MTEAIWIVVTTVGVAVLLGLASSEASQAIATDWREVLKAAAWLSTDGESGGSSPKKLSYPCPSAPGTDAVVRLTAVRPVAQPRD